MLCSASCRRRFSISLTTLTRSKAMVLAMAEKTDALKSEVADLQALNASAEERIARLTSILKTLERARFWAPL